MESHKDRIRKLVELTNREKRGMLFFLFLVILILSIPKIYHRYFDENVDIEGFEAQIFQFPQEQSNIRKDRATPAYSMHMFDPNQASVQELKNLGIPNFLSKRIDLYRERGGRFNTAADIKKIYGFDEDLYARLKPFISIEKQEEKNPVGYPKKIPHTKTSLLIDVNKSDSAEFIKIRGIGPTYASRIVKYRNALGGFYNIEQVSEVYGVSDSLFAAIRSNIFIDTLIWNEKISINTVGVNELKAHPYLRSYNLCNAIVKYREQHGSYDSVESLKNVHLMNDSILERIGPYLLFE